ncbi:MAG: 16S rRNA processing protein RimM [Sulfurospirillum sp.]|nr:16S rRNA processing protein RimM [Sulfurospirillum sp.]MBL0702653.1 16S rRNA processing protein RimM [Sulfurospirillum sp.]
MNREESLIEVAQIGRLVGLRGELKLHVHSDFPEQFKAKKKFLTQKNIELEITAYSEKKGLILFRGYESREAAACLINSYLMTTMKATLEDCNLSNDEFFWFDIIGCCVKEKNQLLGVVDEMHRIGILDYMVIKTDKTLLDKKLPRTLFMPYIDRYIVSMNKKEKTIHVKDGLELLEYS